jgi:hypothetical protein
MEAMADEAAMPEFLHELLGLSDGGGPRNDVTRRLPQKETGHFHWLVAENQNTKTHLSMEFIPTFMLYN